MERSEIRYNDDVQTPDGPGVVFGFGVDGRVMVHVKVSVTQNGLTNHTPWYTCDQLSKPVEAGKKVKHGAVAR